MKNTRKKIDPKDNHGNQQNGQEGNPKPDPHFLKRQENSERQIQEAKKKTRATKVPTAQVQAKKPDSKPITTAKKNSQLKQSKEKSPVAKVPKQVPVSKPIPKSVQSKDMPVVKKKK